MHTYDNSKVLGSSEETLSITGDENKCYFKQDDHQPAKNRDSLEEVGSSICFEHSARITDNADPSG